MREIGDEYVIVLEIRSCKADDEASFRMTATNSAGEATTAAKLKFISEFVVSCFSLVVVIWWT